MRRTLLMNVYHYERGHELREGICTFCGNTFKRIGPKHKRCRSCIRNKRKRKVVADPMGFYVYGWYVAGEINPYYIGKGTGKRAWRKERGNLAVKIIRDGLTEQEAFLIEAVLIDMLESLDIPLINRKRGRGSR